MIRRTADIDALEAEIDELESKLVTARRAAGDLLGDEIACDLAEAEAMTLRLKLDQHYRRYFRITKDAKCPLHSPESLIVTCPDCCRAWQYKPPANDSSLTLEAVLDLSAKLVEEAKRIGTAPVQAFSLVRWVSQLTNGERDALLMLKREE